MRRVLLILGFTACASAGQPGNDTTPKQAVVFTSRETGVMMSDRPHATIATIAAPPATVWLAVKKAYMDWDIPVSVENPPGHQIGNDNFWKMRQMAGHPLTSFVDCGSGPTGPKALTYRVYMSLLTNVATDGQGGTTIQTTFVPMAQDVSGTSSDRIPCGTTGRLEEMLIDQVKATLGK